MSDSLWPHGLLVHRILQARILEWLVFPLSRESSQPRDQTQVSRIASGFFTRWATGEAHFLKAQSFSTEIYLTGPHFCNIKLVVCAWLWLSFLISVSLFLQQSSITPFSMFFHVIPITYINFLSYITFTRFISLMTWF